MIVWLHVTETLLNLLFNFWKRETVSCEIPLSLLIKRFKVHCFGKLASLPRANNLLEEAREAQILKKRNPRTGLEHELLEENFVKGDNCLGN